MVLVSDVIAVVVALHVFNEGLEVEVGQLVHNFEHNVFEELVVELWGARKHLEVAAVLGQASVGHSVVLVVRVHDRVLQPLVVAVAHEALSVLEVVWAVHLTVGAVVRAKSLILAHGVLHEAAAVVHLRVDHLAASPLVSGEWCLINVEDLEPGTHKVLLFKFLLDWVHAIADDVLLTNLASIDGFEGLRHGHYCFNLLLYLSNHLVSFA